MIGRTLPRRARLGLMVTAGLLVCAGAVALIVGWRAQRTPPQPPPAAAGTYALPAPGSSSAASSSAASGEPTVGPSTTGPVLPAATPTRLRIPKIGVDASLLKLGLDKNNAIQVPPLSAKSQPGWYRYSPSPGQLGPSVILGHVDSAKYGPGVFFKLGALRKGNEIDVQRSDGRTAVFRVDAVADYPKAHFPSLTVYGNTDHAALRLITCGGSFDSSTKNYQDNIVAFASLVSSR